MIKSRPSMFVYLCVCALIQVRGVLNMIYNPIKGSQHFKVLGEVTQHKTTLFFQYALRVVEDARV